MFINNTLASIKMMIRARDVLLWLLFFPIILSTVFYFAFGNLAESKTFLKADIAVVNLESNNTFSSVLAEISNSDGTAGENDLFNVSKVQENEGRKLLAEEKIDALLLVTNDNVMLVSSGMDVNGTVVTTFLDNYLSNVKTIENNAASYEQAVIIANQLRSDVEIISKQISKNAIHQNTTYFYALFGMVCFFFSIAGMEVIKLTQPNKSNIAARQSLSPTSRKKIFFSQFTGMFICCICIILIMLFYVGLILGIPLGNIGYVFIACIVGTLAALGFGMLIGTLPIKNQTLKDVLLIVITLVLSFLTGLMGASIKEIITTKARFINYINPVALISDSFHSLYYYDGLKEFLIRIGLLGAYAVIFTVITILMVRRKKYAHI